jgi:large subunit ribosomal protein L24
VQTTLLGLAIAIILALVAALVAPLVVDWNHYRAAIETEASRLSGLAVHVNGAIDARLLPSPAITLRDVAVGEAGRVPAARAGTLKLELALGPLLRGEVQASEVRLLAPQFSLALDRSGAVDLPKLSPAFRPEALSISRFSIEDGRAVLSDAASGTRVALDKLYFNGDVRSFAGPFSGDGGVVVGDALYNYRIVGSSAADGGGIKLRLNVDPANRPLTSVFDGTLTFDRGAPHFDGAVSLARPVGATLANGTRVVSEPWRATAALHVDPAAASLQDVAIHYGPEERAVVFGGKADVAFGAHPHLTADVAAMQVNLDRALADPDLTNRPPLVAVHGVLQAFAAEAKLPLPARVGFRIGALTVGGATLAALHGSVDFDQTGWSLDGVRFDAPGMTEVNLSGRLTGTSQRFVFRGPAALSSGDAGMLLAWLNGHNADSVGETRTLTADGDVTIASDRFAVDKLNAALGHEKVAGRFAYAWPAQDRPAKLDTDLRAAELDLDTIRTFVTSALGSDAFALPQEATVALDIGRASMAGVQARSIVTQIKLDAGKLQIDRLSVGDLGGATLAIGGRIDELSSRPRGQVTLDLDARALEGLSDIAAKFAPNAAVPLRRLAARLAPAKVHAVVNVEHAAGAGSSAALALNGDLAAMRLVVTGKASGEPSHLGAAAMQLGGRLDADDGSALVALLGLDRVVAVDQLPGELTFAATGAPNGEVQVDGKVGASGLNSAISGTVRLSDTQRPWAAQLHVQAAAGDLRPLHQMLTDQPGVAIPVAAQATLAINHNTLSFTDIAGTVGKTAARGQFALDLGSPMAINGRVAADAVDAPELTAMLLGLSDNTQKNGGAQGPGQKNSTGAFGTLNGAVDFKFDRAALTPALIARDLAGTMHFQPAEIGIDDLSGSFAGGHLTASLAFRRNADAVAAHAKVAITDASATTLLGAALNIAGGQVGVTLEADGLGASSAGLTSSLHGSATATLKDARFAGLDPAAFAAALQAAGQTSPVDMNKVQAAVNAALANGRVTVPAAKVTLPIAAGTINLNHVVLPADHDAELVLDGSLNLAAAAVDARLTLSQTPPPNALIAARPEVSVALKGPLGAPARRLDMAALVSWLTLRATELQTRRLEAIEANRQQGAVAQAPHPEPPDQRMPLSGVVVETAAPANASAVPARALERLPPAAPPPLVPDNNQPGSGNAAPAPAPASAQPKDSRAAPQQPKNTATAGTPEPNRPPGVLQLLLPKILRNE